MVDRTILRGCHEPGTGVLGDTGLWPLLERSNQRVVREIFSDPDITYDSRNAGNELRGLDPPDRLDGAMCIGSRHVYQSHLLPPLVQGSRRWKLPLDFALHSDAPYFARAIGASRNALIIDRSQSVRSISAT